MTRDNEFVRDDTFKKFYEEKYNGLTERFNEDKELKEEYQYKEQEYRELKLTEKEKFPKEDVYIYHVHSSVPVNSSAFCFFVTHCAFAWIIKSRTVKITNNFFILFKF